MRLVIAFLLRIAALLLFLSLLSYLAFDQPVLRSVYLAGADFLDFLLHLARYLGPVAGKVWDAYWRSAILLGSALVLGVALGVPLGVAAAGEGRTPLGRLAGLVSSLGLVTPSFLLGLFIMVFFVRYVSPWTGLKWIIVVPSPGLPSPREVLAPALTLAARPIAHIAQVVGIRLREERQRRYVETAWSKGLSGRQVAVGHVWPNLAPSVLRAIQASLLFSLSSLPIVEYVFGWNGLGYTLFQAVLTRQVALASALLAAVGLTIALMEAAIAFLSAQLDPRLRGEGAAGREVAA